MFTHTFSHPPTHTHTHRVYGELPGVSVFLSSWISEILHMQRHIQDIPLGRHILLPKHLQPSTPGTASKTWTNSRDYYDSGRGGAHLGGGPVGVGVSQHRAVLKPVLQSGADSDAEWESLTNLYKKAKLDGELWNGSVGTRLVILCHKSESWNGVSAQCTQNLHVCSHVFMELLFLS